MTLLVGLIFGFLLLCAYNLGSRISKEGNFMPGASEHNKTACAMSADDKIHPVKVHAGRGSRCRLNSLNMDAAAGRYTEEELNSFSIRQLRALAASRGVKVRGAKHEVVSRLSLRGPAAAVTPPATTRQPPVRRSGVVAGPCKRNPDLLYDIYGADRVQRRRMQTDWFVPAVTRAELEDDAASDNRDIERDEDESQSSAVEFEDSESSPGGQNDECTEAEDPCEGTEDECVEVHQQPMNQTNEHESGEESDDECVEVRLPPMSLSRTSEQESDKAAGQESSALNVWHPSDSGGPVHQTSCDDMLSRMDQQMQKIPGGDD